MLEIIKQEHFSLLPGWQGFECLKLLYVDGRVTTALSIFRFKETYNLVYAAIL